MNTVSEGGLCVEIERGNGVIAGKISYKDVLIWKLLPYTNKVPILDIIQVDKGHWIRVLPGRCMLSAGTEWEIKYSDGNFVTKMPGVTPGAVLIVKKGGEIVEVLGNPDQVVVLRDYDKVGVGSMVDIKGNLYTQTEITVNKL